MGYTWQATMSDDVAQAASEDWPVACDVCGGTIYPGECCDDCYLGGDDE